MTLSLDDLISEQLGVLDIGTALKYLTRDQLRWRLATGRWQRPCRKIVIAHSGPISQEQSLWVAVLWAGTGAVLAGLTAARLEGLRGTGEPGPVHLLIQPGRRRPAGPVVVPAVLHYTRRLAPGDVHPLRQPPRTRIARSVIDAARWMPTDRGALAIVAASVQQRLVRVSDLERVLAGNPRLRRRALITTALADIEGGAQALSELDFTRNVVRQYGLPEPSRQMIRREPGGRRRYIDVAWDESKVAVEIDGAQHMDPLQYWDDMDRANSLEIDGYLVLRFPAWLLRRDPGQVAGQIRRALGAAKSA